MCYVCVETPANLLNGKFSICLKFGCEIINETHSISSSHHVFVFFILSSVLLFCVSVGQQTAVRRAAEGDCCSAASKGVGEE